MKNALLALAALLLLGCVTAPVEKPRPPRTAFLVGYIKNVANLEGEFRMEFETAEGEEYILYSPGCVKGATTVVDGPGGMFGLGAYLIKAAYRRLPIGLVIIKESGIVKTVIVAFPNEKLEWELRAEQDVETLPV